MQKLHFHVINVKHTGNFRQNNIMTHFLARLWLILSIMPSICRLLMILWLHPIINIFRQFWLLNFFIFMLLKKLWFKHSTQRFGSPEYGKKNRQFSNYFYYTFFPLPFFLSLSSSLHPLLTSLFNVSSQCKNLSILTIVQQSKASQDELRFLLSCNCSTRWSLNKTSREELDSLLFWPHRNYLWNIIWGYL